MNPLHFFDGSDQGFHQQFNFADLNYSLRQGTVVNTQPRAGLTAPRVHNTHNLPNQAELLASRGRADYISKLAIRQGEEGVTSFTNQEVTERAQDVMKDSDIRIDRATLFEDPLDAIEYRNILLSRSQSFDPTLPTTALQKRACVRLLFKAFKSTYSAADNQGVLKSFNEQRHDNRLVECLCWEILEAIIARCRSNTPLGNTYDPTKAKSNLNITTFDQRFDAVVEALAGSKSMCKHLFDIPFIYHVVDDPIRIFSRIDSNRKLNRQKGEAMRIGKSVIDASKSTDQDKSFPTPPTATQIVVSASTSTPRKRTLHVFDDEYDEYTTPIKRPYTPDSVYDVNNVFLYDTPDTPTRRRKAFGGPMFS